MWHRLQPNRAGSNHSHQIELPQRLLHGSSCWSRATILGDKCGYFSNFRGGETEVQRSYVFPKATEHMGVLGVNSLHVLSSMLDGSCLCRCRGWTKARKIGNTVPHL